VTTAVLATGQPMPIPGRSGKLCGSQASRHWGCWSAASPAAAAWCALGSASRRAFSVGSACHWPKYSSFKDPADTFDPRSSWVPQLRQFLAEHPGEYRILNLWNRILRCRCGLRRLGTILASRCAMPSLWTGARRQSGQRDELRDVSPLSSAAFDVARSMWCGGESVMSIVPARSRRCAAWNSSAPTGSIGSGRDSARPGRSVVRARKEVILEREPHPGAGRRDTQGIARIVREGPISWRSMREWRVRRSCS